MIDSHRSARALYDMLVAFSRDYCNEMGLCVAPGARTRPWSHGGALSGVAYHYTGGPDFGRTARWFNAPHTPNDGSSCHVLIDDGIGDDLLGAMWRESAGLLRVAFPAPLIVLCPWDRGAWATNWANGRCLGVELRNRGFLGAEPAERVASYDGARVERYTAEQLGSALQIGRLACALAPETWSDDYVLGHYSVKWGKRDPGPDFPIHAMRAAIQSESSPAWLRQWPSAAEAPGRRDSAGADTPPDTRGQNAPSGWTDDLRRVMGRDAGILPGRPEFPALVEALWRCGYNVDGLAEHDQARTRRAVAMFQRCRNEGRTDGLLLVDGICGPRTWERMRERAGRGYITERYPRGQPH